jgi:streptogramin lyase
MRPWVLPLLLVVACSGGGGTASPSPTSTLPAGVRSVHVGGSPCGVAEAAGAAWVTDAADARLLRIDPATLEVEVKATLDPTPCELTFAFGALWIVTQSGALDRYDLATGKVTHAPVGTKSYEVEPTADALWVSDRGSAQLTRVDPVTLRTSTLPLPGTSPGGLVFAFGALWVGDDTAGATQLLKVDPRTRRVARVPVGHRPAYVTATADHVWVSNVEDGTVSRVDPADLTQTAQKVGLSPVNLDVLGGRVWVPDDGGDAVYELAADGTVATTYKAPGGGPAVVAPVGEDVWATLFTSGDVWAITP